MSLSPHLLSLGVLPDEPGIEESVSASALFNRRRFGITFKHIYAQAMLLGCKCGYPEQQYRDSIRCITQGTLKEDDGSKSSLDDYVSEFESLLSSVKVFGLFPAHPVPVDRHYTAIDGTHRIASALALGINVPVLRFSHEAPAYTSQVFSGMDCDRAAIEFCRLRPSARIMVLFGDDTRWSVSPVYMKSFQLPTATAQDNLITELYLGEEWPGTSAGGFPGAAPKARPCFARGPMVRVLIVDMPQEEVVKAKSEMRAGTGRDSVHATDTHAETLRVARVLFSATSLAFLSRPHKHMPRLEALLAEYRAIAPDQEFLCISGSAVMARYGLREPSDLDFVHAVAVAGRGGNVSSHNEYSALYPFHRDEMIYDPASHFWSHGYKYGTLDRLRQIKTAIVDDKNATDLKLMEGA